MAKTGKTGVTANTPKQIVFGAGTLHANFDKQATNHDDTIIGATNGGATLTITPELTTIEADGALVAAKGLKVKTGEVATLKGNFVELPKALLEKSVLGQSGTSEISGYEKIESKAAVVEGDYYDNITFVGKTAEGKDIIAILNNALCTSGLELGAENKAGAVAELEFECHQELTEDLDKLPWEIHYPTI